MLVRDSRHPGANPGSVGSDRRAGAGARRLPGTGSTLRRTALANPPGRSLTLSVPTRTPVTLPVPIPSGVGVKVGLLDGLVVLAVVVLVVAVVVAVLMLVLLPGILSAGLVPLLSLRLLLLLLGCWHCCLHGSYCCCAIAC